MIAQSANAQGRGHYARNLAFFAGVAAMGGFLFGFDTAVVSGTIDALREKFALDSLREGWVAISQVDRFGRKLMMMIGAVGVSTILLLLAVLFHPEGTNVWIVPALFLLHVAMFAMSWGPMCWVVIAEIFPTKIRGRAMAIGTFTLWVSNALVVQAFPWLRDNVGPLKTFMIYGLLLAPSILFIWYKLPETKGKTLEEIEEQWQLGKRRDSES